MYVMLLYLTGTDDHVQGLEHKELLIQQRLTVLCDLLDVGATCLYEGVEVPGDRAGALCFTVRHVCRSVLLPQRLSFGCRQTERERVFNKLELIQMC